ncbi:hypothetical protein CHUAL_006706 [Chamberlinius hualienensis]
MNDLTAIMETLNCRSAYLEDMDEDLKRGGDVGFKRNLLSLKSEVAYEDEINGDIVDDVDEDDDDEDDDDDEEEEDDDDGDEYGECYDGPYQFLSDDYDECDFTPHELQQFLYQQQQQHTSMYSLRRYSLLETIQEETSDELRMSSESDELCRSDYSGVWCWGDDYPDDCSESAGVTSLRHPETQHELIETVDDEDNPLSDREGSWLDVDNSLHHSDDVTCHNGDVTSATKTDTNQVASWSDAIDAYLMLRASTNELDQKNDVTVTLSAAESASSFKEDDFIGFRFGKGSISRLAGVKSAPDLFSRNLADDVYSCFANNYAEDDCALKNLSAFSSFANCNSDGIGWNDDINKSQSLPCVNVEKSNQCGSSFSEVVVTPTISTHLDLTKSSLCNASDKLLFIHETDESEYEESEEVSSDESDEFSMFNSRSQSLLRFTRSASLRSFRSFDTLNLAGLTSEDDSSSKIDINDEVDGEMMRSSLNQIPEVMGEGGEEVINDSGFLTQEGSKVDVTFDPCNNSSSCQITSNFSDNNNRLIEEVEDDEIGQLPVSYQHRNVIDEREMCLAHVETSLSDVTKELNEANAIVFGGQTNNGSGNAELPTERSNNESSIESVTSAESGIPCHVVYPEQNSHLTSNNNKVRTNEEAEIEIANPVLTSEMQHINFNSSLHHSDHVIGGVDWVPSCSPMGWELLCLTSDDVDPYVGHRLRKVSKTVQSVGCEASKSSLKLEESFGAIPTLTDVIEVGVGAVKNTLGSVEDLEKKQLAQSINNNKTDTDCRALNASGNTNCVVVTEPPTSDVKQSVRQVQHFPETFKERDQVEEDDTNSSVVTLPALHVEVQEETAEKVTENKNKILKTKSPTKDKMEILTEKDKEKDKKKKSGGKKWWFLPKSKSNEAGTVHVTIPSSNANVNINGKGGGSLSSNGCHGDVTSYADFEERRKEEDLETRLDMETFTNNLWIEFENELKGVWPSSNHGNSSLTSAAHLSPISAASTPTAESSFPKENVNNKQRCLDNGKIIMENNGEKITKNCEVVNHVLKGKPPLPSSAHKGKVKNVAIPKITKKTSVNHDEDEEVNDPTGIFDKFRQIAKEGRDRAAKSIQNLNEIGQNYRQLCPQPDENMAAVKTEEENGQQRRWCESNQSLVGYLETDIDTFHSREVLVIRVPPPNINDSINDASPSRENGAVFSNFSYNIKKHRPVKLKTQSMFNLIDDEHRIDQETSIITPEIDVDADDVTTSNFRAAKSMEFLLKAENKAAVEAPENRLMRLRAPKNSQTSPEVDYDLNRSLSAHEERIRRSLQKLNLPEWYTKSKSKISLNQSNDNLRQDSADERRSLRWEDYRKRNGSSSSVTSPSKSRNTTVINKRVTTPDWRQVRSSRESLAPSPSSAATSSTQLDKTDDSNSYGYGYSGNLSRWGSSRLSTNSSRSSSPISGFISTSNSSFNRPPIKQPYLGWRSSEKLATTAASANETSNKYPEKSFYRSAAERLSKGPGYYALRFGVYSANNSTAENSDISIV